MRALHLWTMELCCVDIVHGILVYVGHCWEDEMSGNRVDWLRVETCLCE